MKFFFPSDGDPPAEGLLIGRGKEIQAVWKNLNRLQGFIQQGNVVLVAAQDQSQCRQTANKV